MGPAASVFDSASLVLTFLNTATLSLLGMTKSPRQLRKIRSHAIFLATSSGLILTGSLVTFAGPLTRFMGATNAMLPLSDDEADSVFEAWAVTEALGSPDDILMHKGVHYEMSVRNTFISFGVAGTAKRMLQRSLSEPSLNERED
eukprot:g3108.t1